MIVYLVFAEGVYRHGCFGVFSSESAAVQHCNKLAETDKDSWHRYEAVPFTLNKPIPRAYCGESQEAEAIYSVKKTAGDGNPHPTTTEKEPQ